MISINDEQSEKISSPIRFNEEGKFIVRNELKFLKAPLYISDIE